MHVRLLPDTEWVVGGKWRFDASRGIQLTRGSLAEEEKVP